MKTDTLSGKSGSNAASREGWMCLAAAALFVLAYFGVRVLLRAGDLSTAARVAICLLPAPAFLWFVWAEVKLLRRQDELQRRIQLEALAIAYPLAIAIVMTISLFQKAGILTWEPMWVYLPITYLLGLVIAQQRYK